MAGAGCHNMKDGLFAGLILIALILCSGTFLTKLEHIFMIQSWKNFTLFTSHSE